MYTRYTVYAMKIRGYGWMKYIYCIYIQVLLL